MRVGYLLVSFLVAGFASASDWNQILGPNRNGVSSETNLAATWPKEGPRILWKMKVGGGWSGPVVDLNRLVLFHRLRGNETVDCLHASNGAVLWKAEYPRQYRVDFGFD